jgi:hypothetical protein
MSLPTEAEQNEILKWQDEQSNMRITDKIFKAMSQAEERLLKQMAPIQEKIEEHEGFISRIRRNFLGIVKG